MKKRLNWILAAVLALAMVLGISFTGTFAAEETAPESYIAVNPSITGDSAVDKLAYVNTPLSLENGLNIYLEVEIGQYTDSVLFVGLFADKTDVNPYAHKSFMISSQDVRSFFNDAATPVSNGSYFENYYGTYFYNKVMFRFEVNANGDVNIYARSTEDPSTYVGDNDQVTTETLIATQAGYYSGLAADEEIYAGFAVRGSTAQPPLTYKLYSMEVRDGSGNQLFSDDGFLKFTTDAYVRSDGIDGAIASGAIEAPEVIEESSLTVTSKMEATMTDTMIYAATQIKGGAEITLDLRLGNNASVLFFGVFPNNTNSNFYSGSSMQMASTGISKAFGDYAALDNGAYSENAEGAKFVDRIRLRMVISASGVLNVYASSIESADTYTGTTPQEDLQDVLIIEDQAFYSEEMTNGGYFGFAFRAPAENQDVTLYSLKIADKDGVTLFQDDFSKILTNSYVRTDANGADTIADPLADNIEKGNVILRIKNVSEPEPVFNYASVKREGYLDESFNLKPAVDDMPEGGALSVVVKDAQGNTVAAQSDGSYLFTAQGIYTAEYAVTLNGETILEDSLNVYVKNHSTQPNAEENFDQGYFNGDLWAISETGVAVKDGELIIADGTFRTNGFSEICYFTFDITSMQEGSTSFDVFFGQDGVGYTLRFTNAATVEFITPEGTQQFEIGKNFVEAALAGKTVTLRLELASDSAMLYGMIEGESVETMETPLCTMEDIRLVGSVGITVPEGSRITVDNVQFVNMAGVDNPNTDPSVPTDPSDPGNTDDPDDPTNPEEPQSGCSGAVAGFSIAGGVLAIIAAAALCFRRKNEI